MVQTCCRARRRKRHKNRGNRIQNHVLFLWQHGNHEVLLSVQVRVLLLAGLPGGGVEERPQGHMQADPADAEEQEITAHIYQKSIPPQQRPLKPQKVTYKSRSGGCITCSKLISYQQN